jgi:hypothetical protein
LDVSPLEEGARLLTSLAIAQPRVAILLLVEPERFDAYVAMTPVSRAKDLLCESVVTLGSSCTVISAPNPARSIEFRESSGPEPVPCGAENAGLASETGNPGLDDDIARSAAERMLFDSLESLPETTGLFELNGALDFCFGSSRRIEIDLVARSVKLAVEIDGYHHFQDLDAYRRDRRKDLELQKHGYLVTRVLADDVIERLESVMGTIRALVTFCRERASHH